MARKVNADPFIHWTGTVSGNVGDECWNTYMRLVKLAYYFTQYDILSALHLPVHCLIHAVGILKEREDGSISIFLCHIPRIIATPTLFLRS